MRTLTQQQIRPACCSLPVARLTGSAALHDCMYSCCLLLLQAHAEVVSKFVKNGMSEHHKAHEVPQAAKAGLALS